MVNIAIFASGNGSNFENLVNHMNDKSIPNAQCAILIVDKEKAFAIERAKKLHIPYVYVNPKAYVNKEAYESEIEKILKEKQVELIVLAGYMRFIGKVLLEAFPNRIINLHPAYLPAFPGAHSILDAFSAKASYTGVSVHYVDEGVDSGEIIRQEKISIDPNESLETLEEHIHAMEYKLFPEVVYQVCSEIEKNR
ncbi:MAG: phosphoribosylglycinamide formyltransferase [Longicatena sp.]